MNFNNGPFPYPNPYQASANDYPDYQECEGENDDLNENQTNVQAYNNTDPTYADEGAEQIYAENADYEQDNQLSYEQHFVPCKRCVTKNEGYYRSLPYTQAPRLRQAIRRYPTSALYMQYARQRSGHRPTSPDPEFVEVAPVDVAEAEQNNEFYNSYQNYSQPYGDAVAHHSSQKVFPSRNYVALDVHQTGYEPPQRQIKPGHGVAKKYPVTLKMPKYYTKKSLVPQFNTRRPSALSLPIPTQPKPSYSTQRKIKQKYQDYKKERTEVDPYASFDECQHLKTHQINSHGDGINSELPVVENVMEKMKNENYEKKLVEEPTGDVKKTVKEFSKYFKPKVPSTIKTKQEQATKVLPVPITEANLELNSPKKKMSLEQLLNSLRKCETENKGKSKPNETKNLGPSSSKKPPAIFNYENISKNIAPKEKNKFEEHIPRASTSLTTSLDQKKSLDDYGALELHRSKSYIVNLIDRALSKELGTIARERLPVDEMSTKKALKSISRHHGPPNKELCYEVTAALTDSFISNVTAPQIKEADDIIIGQEETFSEGSEKNKLCSCNLDDSYVKQLKQLRWGHIRHIQHEARRLADLEEFLDKIGETDL